MGTFNTDTLIGLDFETYGSVDLTVHGLERYCSDPHFRPLIASAVSKDFSRPSWIIDRFDFTNDFDGEVDRLRRLLDGRIIVAHNAGFERRVLQAIGIDLPADRFIDSAVVARAAGAAGKLEAAAPQLLDAAKMEEGWPLIKLFSIPSVDQHNAGIREWDSTLPARYPTEWATFAEYCDVDARLGLRLVLEHGVHPYTGVLSTAEIRYMAVTMEMNQVGWPVDVDKVEEMQRRYLENVEAEVERFRAKHDADELNLNSLKQLKEWCADRGIKATSFDEKNVAKLKARIEKKIDTLSIDDPKFEQYSDVIDLLHTKQILGGSSLKKLRVILDTVGEDGRLRDQYLHIGAGQSWRTTGRSVQMQNLKRLSTVADMDELDDPGSEWDNDKLAENTRQVFTSSHPDGALIVGDFSSIESRGLAWLACAWWKLEAYSQGKDMYKVLASDMFSKPYDQIIKVERQAGKVGELSCGYQASGDAVKSFAEGMGIEMNEAEAAKLVFDWRRTNPEVVNLWAKLDALLLKAFKDGQAKVSVGYDYVVTGQHCATPASLLRQHPGAQSLEILMHDEHGNLVLRRRFHGCYERGRGLCYYKPTERKTGDVWVNHYTDPKTKQVRFYSIYGGKLTGILTQSFCRQLFFRALLNVHMWTRAHSNIDLIGQFHDEIVLDWRPGVATIPLDEAKAHLEAFMSDPQGLKGFPMAAEIKHDYRYTK